MVLKDNQYIIDLEDNYSGECPPLIYLYWDPRRNYLPVKLEVAAPPVKLEVAAPEFEGGQGHTRHVCGICRCAECDGTSCDPHDFIQNKRQRRAYLPVKLEVAV